VQNLHVANSDKQVVDKATDEYKKYTAMTLSDVEQDYLDSIRMLEKKTEKNDIKFQY
jgi:hypothetical protein